MRILLNQDGSAGGGSGGSGGAGGSGAGGSGGSSGGSGGTGGAGTPWYAGLPEDIRADPSIVKFTSQEELARGYVNAQRLIGTKRLEAPQPTWTEKEWSALYDTLGRPKELERYTLPQGTELPDGFKFDDVKLKSVRETFHKHGLTEQQGQAVLGLYAKSLADAAAADKAAQTAALEKATADLKAEFGGEFDAKIALGRSAIEKLGGEPLRAWLNTSGAGNNPVLIKAMIKLGELMQGDSARGSGDGSGTFTAEQEAARSEIAGLRTNADFMRQLTTQHDPGHMAAVVRWETAFKKAYPGKVAE